MSEFNKFLRKNSFHIFLLLGTIILCYILARYVGPKSDYVFFITMSLSFLLIFQLYLIIFKTHNITRGLLILYTLFLIISVNHYYSYKEIIRIFPWITSINKEKYFMLLVCSSFLILILYKYIMLTFYDTFLKEINSNENLEKNSFYSETGNCNNKHIKLTTFIILFVPILIAICCLIFFIKNDLNIKKINSFNIISKITSYALCLLFVLIIIYLILMIIFEIWHLIIKKLKNFSLIGHLEDSPHSSYLFSIIIFFILLYSACEINSFKLDDFYNFISVNDYIALPLTLLVGITTFFIFVQIIHSLLEIMENTDALKIKENTKNIVKIVFDIVFNTIFSVLEFARFIPTFFDTLQDMVLGQNKNINNDEQKQKDDIK